MRQQHKGLKGNGKDDEITYTLRAIPELLETSSGAVARTTMVQSTKGKAKSVAISSVFELRQGAHETTQIAVSCRIEGGIDSEREAKAGECLPWHSLRKTTTASF